MVFVRTSDGTIITGAGALDVQKAFKPPITPGAIDTFQQKMDNATSNPNPAKVNNIYGATGMIYKNGDEKFVTSGLRADIKDTSGDTITSNGTLLRDDLHEDNIFPTASLNKSISTYTALAMQTKRDDYIIGGRDPSGTFFDFMIADPIGKWSKGFDALCNNIGDMPVAPHKAKDSLNNAQGATDYFLTLAKLSNDYFDAQEVLPYDEYNPYNPDSDNSKRRFTGYAVAPLEMSEAEYNSIASDNDRGYTLTKNGKTVTKYFKNVLDSNGNHYSAKNVYDASGTNIRDVDMEDKTFTAKYSSDLGNDCVFVKARKFDSIDDLYIGDGKMLTGTVQFTPSALFGGDISGNGTMPTVGDVSSNRYFEKVEENLGLLNAAIAQLGVVIDNDEINHLKGFLGVKNDDFTLKNVTKGSVMTIDGNYYYSAMGEVASGYMDDGSGNYVWDMYDTFHGFRVANDDGLVGYTLKGGNQDVVIQDPDDNRPATYTARQVAEMNFIAHAMLEFVDEKSPKTATLQDGSETKELNFVASMVLLVRSHIINKLTTEGRPPDGPVYETLKYAGMALYDAEVKAQFELAIGKVLEYLADTTDFVKLGEIASCVSEGIRLGDDLIIEGKDLIAGWYSVKQNKIYKNPYSRSATLNMHYYRCTIMDALSESLAFPTRVGSGFQLDTHHSYQFEWEHAAHADTFVPVTLPELDDFGALGNTMMSPADFLAFTATNQNLMDLFNALVVSPDIVINEGTPRRIVNNTDISDLVYKLYDSMRMPYISPGKPGRVSYNSQSITARACMEAAFNEAHGFEGDQRKGFEHIFYELIGTPLGITTYTQHPGKPHGLPEDVRDVSRNGVPIHNFDPKIKDVGEDVWLPESEYDDETTEKFFKAGYVPLWDVKLYGKHEFQVVGFNAGTETFANELCSGTSAAHISMTDLSKILKMITNHGKADDGTRIIDVALLGFLYVSMTTEKEARNLDAEDSYLTSNYGLGGSAPIPKSTFYKSDQTRIVEYNDLMPTHYDASENVVKFSEGAILRTMVLPHQDPVYWWYGLHGHFFAVSLEKDFYCISLGSLLQAERLYDYVLESIWFPFNRMVFEELATATHTA